jgi:hypothetical protein
VLNSRCLSRQHTPRRDAGYGSLSCRVLFSSNLGKQMANSRLNAGSPMSAPNTMVPQTKQVAGLAMSKLTLPARFRRPCRNRIPLSYGGTRPALS